MSGSGKDVVMDSREATYQRLLKVMFFFFLIMVALFVILTCIWKIVKLIALYQMESRIEELEHKSGTDNEVIVSPKEARTLRRLSILAGFDRRRRRSSSVKTQFNPFGFRNRVADLFGARNGQANGNPDMELPLVNPPILPYSRQNGKATLIGNNKTQISAVVECPAHSHHYQKHAQNQCPTPTPPLLTPSPSPPPPPPKRRATFTTNCAVHGSMRVPFHHHSHRPTVPFSKRLTNKPSSPVSSWSPDPCSPPSPAPLLHCLNPHHHHIQPLHVHRCKCGASFPNIPMQLPPISSNSVSNDDIVYNRKFGGSDPNVTESMIERSESSDEEEEEEEERTGDENNDDTVTVVEKRYNVVLPPPLAVHFATSQSTNPASCYTNGQQQKMTLDETYSEKPCVTNASTNTCTDSSTAGGGSA